MINPQNIILVGGGGHCKSVIEVAESAGCSILGILDLPEQVGNNVFGYPIIGTDAMINQYVDKAVFLVTVGQIKDASLRIKLHKNIQMAGGTFATLVAPTAYVSRHATIGKGTVIMHHAFVNADAHIANVAHGRRHHALLPERRDAEHRDGFRPRRGNPWLRRKQVRL